MLGWKNCDNNVSQSLTQNDETNDTIDETSPLTSGLDLLLAPIMPTEQTDSSSIDSSGPSPVIPVEPDSQSIQVDKISISGRERRPNISRRCRRRIFALWEEFKTLFPIKPQKKDAGYFIAVKINSEFPDVNITPQQVTRVLYNVYQYKEHQGVPTTVLV
ncbi:hypothetical protein WA171_003061 [Blastocystis sp. BT1]